MAKNRRTLVPQIVRKKYAFNPILCFLSILFITSFLEVFGVPPTANGETIPRAAEQHRATLTRTAHSVWGINAPIAVFAGQIHAESRWNPDAKSYVGAQGLAQFMPATASWLPTIAPETGEPMPTNPGWAIRALITYDLWLWNRTTAVNNYEKMAFVLSKYNGGETRLNREMKKAQANGFNPKRWFGHVENVNCGRSVANKKENQAYPRKILEDFQWRYFNAGWGDGLKNPDNS